SCLLDAARRQTTTPATARRTRIRRIARLLLRCSSSVASDNAEPTAFTPEEAASATSVSVSFTVSSAESTDDIREPPDEHVAPSAPQASVLHRTVATIGCRGVGIPPFRGGMGYEETPC